jgi:hypothetical protein
MRLAPLLIATSAALLAAGAADLSARWADEAAIRQTVQYYFDGGKNPAEGVPSRGTDALRA